MDGSHTHKKYTLLPQSPNYYKNLEQGTDEWKQARKDFVLTGSELGSLLNINSYNVSKKNLFQYKKTNTEKQYSDYQINTIFKWGNTNEPIAAGIFETWYKKNVSPSHSVKATGSYPFTTSKSGYYVAASPDRLVLDNVGQIISVVEIKCPWKKELYWNGIPEFLKITRAQHGILPVNVNKEIVNLRLPNDYFVQIQMQMAATKTTMGYFVGWAPNEFIIIEVQFSSSLWYNFIEPEIEQFAHSLVDSSSDAKIQSLIEQREFRSQLTQMITLIQDESNKLLYYKTL